MKQKTKKVNITIGNECHYQAKNACAKYKFSQKDFAETAINSFLYTLQQAEIGGVAKQDMQEFIETYLANQVIKNDIIQYAEVFVENQKDIEEALKKD